jgi:hypothetical protein
VEASGHDLIEILSRHSSGGSEEYHEKPVRIAIVLVEILIEHFRNTNLENYHYTNMLSLNGKHCRYYVAYFAQQPGVDVCLV